MGSLTGAVASERVTEAFKGSLRATETVLGGQFDWGGRLRKSNGGVQRFSQVGWKSTIECNGIRELNCKTDGSSRCESRS